MKRILILLFIISNWTMHICAADYSFLKPKNNKLYTEFNFEKKSPFLKKSILGSGYLAMNKDINGNDKFIYYQKEPSKIKILIDNNKIFYSKDNNSPVEINAIQDNELIYIFTENNIEKYFVIKNEGDNFELIPTSTNKFYNKISRINVIRTVSDKDFVIKYLEINYVNKTIIKYYFFNTFVGKDLDEKIFN